MYVRLYVCTSISIHLCIPSKPDPPPSPLHTSAGGASPLSLAASTTPHPVTSSTIYSTVQERQTKMGRQKVQMRHTHLRRCEELLTCTTSPPSRTPTTGPRPGPASQGDWTRTYVRPPTRARRGLFLALCGRGGDPGVWAAWGRGGRGG
jgi:hypothetical protein